MKFLNKIIEWGVYLFIFLLPWQTRLILKEGDLNGYWEYGTASVYGTEILLYFLFLLAIASLVIDKLQIQNYKDCDGCHIFFGIRLIVYFLGGLKKRGAYGGVAVG